MTSNSNPHSSARRPRRPGDVRHDPVAVDDDACSTTCTRPNAAAPTARRWCARNCCCCAPASTARSAAQRTPVFAMMGLPEFEVAERADDAVAPHHDTAARSRQGGARVQQGPLARATRAQGQRRALAQPLRALRRAAGRDFHARPRRPVPTPGSTRSAWRSSCCVCRARSCSKACSACPACRCSAGSTGSTSASSRRIPAKRARRLQPRRKRAGK